MRSHLSAAVVLYLLSCRVASAFPVDTAKLRQEAKLPAMTVNFFMPLSASTSSDTRTYANPPLQSLSLPDVSRRSERAPEDADTAFHLGELLREAKQNAKAQQVYRKAERLYRKQWLAHPKAPYPAEMLARSLQSQGKTDEAEPLLRRMVAKTPDNPRLRIALGQLLQEKVWTGILPNKPGEVHAFQAQDFFAALAYIQSHKPASQKRQALQQSLEETTRCFDIAVALAPHSADTYRARAAYRMSKGILSLYLSTPKRNMPSMAKQFFTSGTVDDCWQAVYLEPKNYSTILSAIMLEVIRGSIEQSGQQGMENGAFWEALSEVSQQRLAGARILLEKIARSGNPRQAAEGAMGLGFLDYLKGEKEDAEKSLRQAIALDASSPKAWELLTGLLVQEEQFSELVTLYRQRILRDNSATNHLMLAKFLEKAGEEAQVAEQVRAAQQLAPKNSLVLLASAIVALKRDDKAALPEAGKLLQRAQNAMHQDADTSDRAQLAYVRAIYLGLTNRAAEAKALLKPLAEDQQLAESVTALLEALD